MTISRIYRSLALAALALLGLVPALAFAQSATVQTSVRAAVQPAQTSAQTSVQVQAQVPRLAGREAAAKEIDRRLAALESQIIRVKGMLRVSESVRNAVATNLQNQITALAGLRASVTAAASLDALKKDVKTIQDSYHLFSLAVPQAHIVASADRIATVSAMLTNMGQKLEARFSALQGEGKDVTQAAQMLQEFSAKIAESQTRAQAAFDVIAGLTPDGGDKTKKQENIAALKKARADIADAHKALENARKDARAMMDLLKNLSVSASAAATTTVAQ